MPPSISINLLKHICGSKWNNEVGKDFTFLMLLCFYFFNVMKQVYSELQDILGSCDGLIVNPPDSGSSAGP